MKAYNLVFLLVALFLTPPLQAQDMQLMQREKFARESLFSDGLYQYKQKNYSKAHQKFRQAVARGEHKSHFYLGMLYYYGWGCQRDLEQALEHFLAARNYGIKEAAMMLGRQYELGLGTKVNLEKAYEYYQEALKKDPLGEAHLALGGFYFNGKGAKQDYSKAFQMYRIAAVLGNSLAKYNLGFMYERGMGIKRNIIKAIESYSEAAEKDEVKSIYRLGKLFHEGIEIKANLAEAEKWFRRGYQLGHAESGICLAGICYDSGRFEEAFKLYNQASETDERALVALAIMHEKGEATPVNQAKAIQLLTRAAEMDYEVALYQLGLRYLNGRGVKADKNIALRLIAKAADKGYQPAKDFLENN